jgi:hypothetical protein
MTHPYVEVRSIYGTRLPASVVLVNDNALMRNNAPPKKESPGSTGE